MLAAPFPWFGGKSRVAGDVWAALGDVDNYIEPFAGSLAVLLGCPHGHRGTIETVNDKDQYIANFWRALAKDPDQVAHYADWPVNEADLFARHLWLVNTGREQMQAGMNNDPEWYDAKIAGWWVWGICSWIGSGWCSGKGAWTLEDGRVVRSGNGDRVTRKLVHLGDGGKGVNRQLVHLGNGGKGVMSRAIISTGLYEYMNHLAARLRHVRVVCGDWARVVTEGAMAAGGTVGVFLDPPYSKEAGRDTNIYSVEDLTVAHDVRRWALANGDNPRLRVVLAGYEGEHDMPATWRVMTWKANASYQGAASNGRNQENRHRERLWFSPHCLNTTPTLFELHLYHQEPCQVS